VVAADALAIYVHAGNPLSSIALTDLAEIFGEGGAIETWPALGVQNHRCRGGRVIRVGRQSNSGTFTYFHHIVLGSTREYKMGSIDQNGSKDVVALISRTPCAIGYSGIAYATDGVRTLAVRSRPDAPAILPSEHTVVDGTYPLARPLYLYTAGNAPQPVSDFIDWVLAPSGQAVVHALGFVPATALSEEGEP
jgi:phosphate transport system substrate-binding protein